MKEIDAEQRERDRTTAVLNRAAQAKAEDFKKFMKGLSK